ncbi:phosphotransferase [Candidatus Pelagibacter sp. Uisw_099_02]|jgi:aminoglycoside/choline kinase family phosphotransferase|uniref:aminoglycoside phosphotransferase family protein n=1 Tax=Candidatus Pelagibacter sp. Uisw_099_02 TaxID=3230981 RepID=UPI00236CA18A|nr:phosphotransferase [Candidatus Pelagibacter sp.]
MRLFKSTLKKIKGDASFRFFYRKKNNKKNSIIVYATKEKVKNLLIYDAINSLLIENKILAPKLYKENYKQNSIEIEDFGDETIFKLLKKNGSNKINLYKKSIDLLSNIQKIKQNKIKNFKGKNYNIPVYDDNKLLKEAKLFSDWYTKKYISKKKLKTLNIEINKQIKFLISNLKLKNDTFVHRDFHVSNLMRHKKQFATIDTQDALIGNRAYDLASLIDDVRFKSNKKLKERIYNYYLKLNNKKINKAILLNDFEILSVLRNMKIIGIFVRLAVRDKKKTYLKLIPYAWKLIEFRMQNSEIFGGLKRLLDINFPKKIRTLK